MCSRYSHLSMIQVLIENGTVTDAGKGVDVLDTDGTLLARVQTNFTAQNFSWTGSGFQDLWIVGNSGAARVKWNLPGQDLRYAGYLAFRVLMQTTYGTKTTNVL
jgi:hypothetical protein